MTEGLQGQRMPFTPGTVEDRDRERFERVRLLVRRARAEAQAMRHGETQPVRDMAVDAYCRTVDQLVDLLGDLEVRGVLQRLLLPPAPPGLPEALRVMASGSDGAGR